MASYVFARICDERHRTREDALADVVQLVRDEYYYTRNEAPPKIVRRTPMIVHRRLWGTRTVHPRALRRPRLGAAAGRLPAVPAQNRRHLGRGRLRR